MWPNSTWSPQWSNWACWWFLPPDQVQRHGPSSDHNPPPQTLWRDSWVQAHHHTAPLSDACLHTNTKKYIHSICDITSLCLSVLKASKHFLLLPLAFNYGPDKFPFREINICLFIKKKRCHLECRHSGERTKTYICSLFIILLQHFFWQNSQ